MSNLKRFLIFSFVIFYITLIGCVISDKLEEVSEQRQEKIENYKATSEQIGDMIWLVTYGEHEYIVFTRYNQGTSMVHSESCSARH